MAALALAAIGVGRGVAARGHAPAMRLAIAIAPPVDDGSRAIAAHVVRDRVGADGDVRVSVAGDQIVVELADADAQLAALISELIARTAHVELRAGDEVVIDGREIVRAEVASGGVDVQLDPAVARRFADAMHAHPGSSLAVMLDGKLHVTALTTAAATPVVHLATTSVDAALDLVAVLDAGAVHALRVTSTTPVTQGGFVASAWPFFALALASLLGAAAIRRRARRSSL